MRILFIHQNFPAQFRHLASALAQKGHQVLALAHTPRAELPGVRVHKYPIERASTKGIHPFAIDFESQSIRAEASAKAMLELRASGFEPDLVVGHPGWGELWLVKEVWPKTPVLAFQEFYYGADIGFDPEFDRDVVAQRWRARLKNISVLAGLDVMDHGLSPTAWQRAQFPEQYQGRISVIFDGIDTDVFCPSAAAAVTFEKARLTLRPGDEVVTFINRNLEPYRGYHSFMRALPILFRMRPNARVVVVGGSERGYGATPDEGTWRERFWNEVRGQLDPTKVHFVGRIPHSTLLSLYQVSACHVYLTYPFVLSWSMLECMSAGGLIVGSKTPPVEEIIVDGDNGLLVDFFDPEAIARTVAGVLTEPARYAPLRKAARQLMVDRYDLKRSCLPEQLALVERLAQASLGKA